VIKKSKLFINELITIAKCDNSNLIRKEIKLIQAKNKNKIFVFKSIEKNRFPTRLIKNMSEE